MAPGPSTRSISRSPSLTPPPEYIPQPDHFYATVTLPTLNGSKAQPSSVTNVTNGLGEATGHGSRHQLKMNVSRDLRPEDDPLAARGIPVFKPSFYEFQDFEKYMKSIEPWGTRSGIVKVIPPSQWTQSLPDSRPLLENIRIKHPIEQNMLGRSGLFRQQNIEKRRVYSLREWFELGLSEDFRTPRGDEVLNRAARTERTTRRNRSKKEGSTAPETIAPLSPSPAHPSNEDRHSQAGQDEDAETDEEQDEIKHEATTSSIPPATNGQTTSATPNGDMSLDPTTTTPNDSTTANAPLIHVFDSNAPNPTPADLAALAAAALAKAQRLALSRARKAARAAERTDLDAAFLQTFDPTTSWLPNGMNTSDFADMDFLDGLERNYWRSCGVGKEAMYGADLPGSLFSTNLGATITGAAAAGTGNGNGTEDYSIGIDKTWRVQDPATKKAPPIPWDVSNLPSALTRLLPRGMRLPGVNTPYLYFGMWKATFAWHVEDMDLFSINYLHWGAPKHWYAVPQARANALESAMRSFFPTDKNGCPQFLRHKSYLASPTVLRSASVKPNALVQNAGEFVITYPRGYHAGFNTGLNCAESVNFALDSWLDLGRKAKFCRCVSDSVRIDVDALLAEKALIEAEERAGIRRPQAEIRQARVKPVLPPQAYIAPPSSNRPRKRNLSEFLGDGASVISSNSLPNPSLINPGLHYWPLNGSGNKRLRREVSTKILPCCLCASSDREGLLPVHDKPFVSMGVAVPIGENGEEEWMAHEHCAMVIPETWVDEVGGEKRVFGVDSVSKDRWALRCGACTNPEAKAHGAPIQCAKGKCSKSFHVNCAKEGKSGASFKVLETQELEVLIAADAVPAVDVGTSTGGAAGVDKDSTFVGVNGTVVDQNAHRVLKTITKLHVELLCGQHNPSLSIDKRKAKSEAMYHALSNMPNHARVKIKLPTGIFECTLVGFDKESETIQVLWSNGQKKMHKWSVILWDVPSLNKASTSSAANLNKVPGTSIIRPTKPLPSSSKPRPKPATSKKPTKPRAYVERGPAMPSLSSTSSLPQSQAFDNRTTPNVFFHMNPGQMTNTNMFATYPTPTPGTGPVAPSRAIGSHTQSGVASGSGVGAGRGMKEVPTLFPLSRVDAGSSGSSDVDVSMTSHADEGKNSMDGSLI